MLPEITAPPPLGAIATSLLAVIGALANDQVLNQHFLFQFLLMYRLFVDFFISTCIKQLLCVLKLGDKFCFHIQQASNLFVRDFILTRLLDLDFCADFNFPHQDDPFDLLKGVLRFNGRGTPEFRHVKSNKSTQRFLFIRLQKQSSMNTLLACYQVGVYCDRQLVGEGWFNLIHYICLIHAQY